MKTPMVQYDSYPHPLTPEDHIQFATLLGYLDASKGTVCTAPDFSNCPADHNPTKEQLTEAWKKGYELFQNKDTDTLTKLLDYFDMEQTTPKE
jgi:hypothetical protein